jgi:phosphoribosyl-ATP pyrophosphohydrolase/phosphoribosyl-AMP cyclohydrolase
MIRELNMSTLVLSADLDRLDFSKGDGLVTVVAQDARTGAVLMVAHADRDALERTLSTGEMHYRSRTRGLWRKGDTSGNVQRVVALHHDCDGDAVLASVTPAGPACHTGSTGCFGAASDRSDRGDALDRLDATIRARVADESNASSYTRRLLADRNLRLKKIGEEAAELVVACADEERERARNEAADLLYHMLVALRPLGVGINDIRATLDARA